MSCNLKPLTTDLHCQSPLPAGIYNADKGDVIWPSIEHIHRSRAGKQSRVHDVRFITERKQTANLLTVKVSDDCSLSIYNGLWSSDTFELQYQGSGWYMLDFRLAGAYVESFAGHERRLDPLTASLCLLEAGYSYKACIAPQQPITLICLSFHSSFLEKVLGLNSDQVYALLQAPSSRAPAAFFSQVPTTVQMQHCACELLAAETGSSQYLLYAKAKVMELISLYIGHLEQISGKGMSQAVISNNTQKLYQAKNTLTKNIKTPPTIDQLCLQVGLSRTRLTEGFKTQFEVTIQEYIQRLRIEAAKKMLNSGAFRIQTVSEEVGYEHQGNFTRAFKRTTGVSPKEYGQHML